jgi:hypothetical protein
MPDGVSNVLLRGTGRRWETGMVSLCTGKIVALTHEALREEEEEKHMRARSLHALEGWAWVRTHLCSERVSK